MNEASANATTLRLIARALRLRGSWLEISMVMVALTVGPDAESAVSAS